MKEIDETKVTFFKNIPDGTFFPVINRLEIINHATNDHQVGRLLTLYKSMGDFESIEISIQDGGKTLKIFLE